MTPFRAISLLACLFGFAVLSTGCRTAATGETFRYGFSDLKSHEAAHPGAADLQLNAKSWKHEWRCNPFEVCTTDFVGTLFVFDRRTGKQVKWNRIEVFQKDACNASAEDRHNYKTVTDAEFVSVGWGDDRNGKYEQVSAFLVFYADWGSVNARVRTLPCP